MGPYLVHGLETPAGYATDKAAVNEILGRREQPSADPSEPEARWPFFHSVRMRPRAKPGRPGLGAGAGSGRAMVVASPRWAKDAADHGPVERRRSLGTGGHAATAPV